MLNRMMRRLGVNTDNPKRESTYVETVLTDVLDRVAERLHEDPSQDPLTVAAKEVLRFECERDNLDVPEFDDFSITAARNYLVLLHDNDIFPPEGQLTRAELLLTRQLLMSHSTGEDEAAERSDEVLTLLEEKFNGGRFTEASLLLRLFETTAGRRRNNERTLFYEEMIARFGVLRSQRIPTGLTKRFLKILKADKEPEARLLGAAEWLGQHAGVQLHVMMRRPDEAEAWSLALKDVVDEAQRDLALAVLPPARWRQICEYEDFGVAAAFADHLARTAIGEWLRGLMKACYFVVLVTGRTGFESYIRDFYNWVETFFGFPGAQLLPELHRRTTIGEAGLEETVSDLLAERMIIKVQTTIDSMDEATMLDAIADLTVSLEKLDPNDIPPGQYNLTGLLLDHITGLVSEDPVVMFRVHRIC